MPTKFASVAVAFALLLGAGAVSANEGGHAGWQRQADNEVGNLPSLQRGARNFMAYCSGCHSLKFDALFASLRGSEDPRRPARRSCWCRPGDKPTDYLKASMPADGRRGVVRQGAAGPVAGGAFARQRLDLQLPHHVSTPIRPAARPASTTCSCRARRCRMCSPACRACRTPCGATWNSKGEDGKPIVDARVREVRARRRRQHDTPSSTTSSCATR